MKRFPPVKSSACLRGSLNIRPSYAGFDWHRNPENPAGVASLILWLLFLVVAEKYVLLVMRADSNGESEIFALMALAWSLLAASAC